MTCETQTRVKFDIRICRLTSEISRREHFVRLAEMKNNPIAAHNHAVAAADARAMRDALIAENTYETDVDDED
jgi:hypothetical protein